MIQPRSAGQRGWRSRLGIIAPALIFISISAQADVLPLKINANETVFKGNFDREAIRRSLLAIAPQFAKCKSDKSLKYNIEFQIDSKGKARAISNHGYPLPSDAANDCAVAIIETINFPAKAKDSTESVIVPVVVGDPQFEMKKTTVKILKTTQELEPKATELSEADKMNAEYLERVKAKAIQEMNAQSVIQNAQLKATLACNDAYAKDNLMEKYDQCLKDAKYGGAKAAMKIPEKTKVCHQSCEANRTNREVRCQSVCGGNFVQKQNCISTCQRDIQDSLNQCKNGCL